MLTVSVLYSKMKKFLFNFTFLKVARETQGKQKNFLSLFDSKNFGETNKKCFTICYKRSSFLDSSSKFFTSFKVIFRTSLPWLLVIDYHRLPSLIRTQTVCRH